jgi:uncharacterized membrane protein
MEEYSCSLLAYCWAQSQHMFGRGKEHYKNPAWIFIYLLIYLSIYLSFITRLLHAKQLDKSIKAQDRKEIQIPKRITQVPVNKTHTNYPNTLI